jgi:hypothetical protein
MDFESIVTTKRRGQLPASTPASHLIFNWIRRDNEPENQIRASTLERETGKATQCGS